MQNTDLTKKQSIIKQKKLLNIKMDKDILTFGDIEIEKNKFYRNKIPAF